MKNEKTGKNIASSKNMNKPVITCWFGPMQGNKITLPSDFLMLVFACISRGLRHKNPVKTNTKSTFYVADFEDSRLKKANPTELFWDPKLVQTA